MALSEIIQQSGGSLSTLYNLFGGKGGLLAAIVAEKRLSGLKRLDEIVARGADAVTTLHAVAISIHCDLTHEDLIAIVRMVVVEAVRDPDIARSTYESMHLSQVFWLANLFSIWTARGQARIADPKSAAEGFIGLIPSVRERDSLWSCHRRMVVIQHGKRFGACHAYPASHRL